MIFILEKCIIVVISFHIGLIVITPSIIPITLYRGVTLLTRRLLAILLIRIAQADIHLLTYIPTYVGTI